MALNPCSKLVLGESFTSTSTLSTDSATSITQNMQGDQFESILDRTTQTDCTTKIEFVSQGFFTRFAAKMQSDFSSSINIDRTSFVSKVTTHTKGMKCDIAMDSHFRTVTVTGVGHKTWREFRFPAIARSLFKRFVAHADELSQVSQSNQNDDQKQATGNDDYYVATPAVNPITPVRHLCHDMILLFTSVLLNGRFPMTRNC